MIPKKKAKKTKKPAKKLIKTYLTKKGYTIIKEHFGFRDIHKCKKELTVAPFVNKEFAARPSPFAVYLENSKKLYIPKHYGFKTFGEPDENRMSAGTDIDLEFKGDLRDYQKPIVKAFLDTCEEGGTLTSQTYGGVISVPCGFGKCLGINTPILMFDGSIKMVQDVVVGDLLMGDDSKPRKVLSLARGRETMYKVIPIKGKPYIVNKSHILSLKSSTNWSKKYYKGCKVDMSVTEYLGLPKSFHGKGGPLLGYKVPVEFPKKQIYMHPYLLGFWLFNQTDDYDTMIIKQASQFKKIEKLFSLIYPKLYLCYLDNYNYKILGKGELTFKENRFLKHLKYYGLFDDQFIPKQFKCNVKSYQKELLAGIIDTCGVLNKGCYEVINTNKRLIDDLIYVCRSLGFAAYPMEVILNGEKYYKTNIHGEGLETLPIVSKNKKSDKRGQIKDALSSRIRLEKLEVDDYYGFTIDGNHRFLLGDFTVTHNTIMSLNLVTQLKKKTLIIVHKEFLIDQWVERIKQFLPYARIGLIRQKKIDVKNRDIVIGMLQSIAMKNYSMDIFKDFGFCIIDECHHIAANVFSRALPKIGCKYMCGLSATPTRDDGLSKVFKWYLGPIVYKVNKRDDDNVKVNILQIKSDAQPYTKIELTNFGKVCMARMINNICAYEKRTNLIVELVRSMLLEDRKILILSDRRAHLKEMYDKISENVSKNVGYYVGGMKQSSRKESESMDIILGTFSMASEGMDIPALDSIILASPKSNICQPIGRILRKKHTDKPALVYDLVDEFSHFYRQGLKRRKFYKKSKYHIIVSKIYDTEATNIEDMLKQINDSQEKIADSVFSSSSNSDEQTTKKKKFKKSKKSKKKTLMDLAECPL